MTKHDLKELAAMGAELGAAKAEIQTLRTALLAIDQRNDNPARFDQEIDKIVRAALSQQPEPTDTYTAVDMATAAAQGFRDGQAAVEQATAQDDQYPPCDYCGVIPDHHPWHGSGMFNGEDSPHIHACNDCRHLLPARPAQTEQQPVGWIHEDELPEGYPYDAMFPFSKVDVVRMFPVYAPIAQNAQQGKFAMGDLVKKSTGSEWEGRVVGWYSTDQTPEGYAVESSAHRNSVQIYPVTALEAVE